MSSFLIMIASLFYILGIYFFFLKKNYCGFDTLALRVLCFVISPFMVPMLLWEAARDYIRGSVSRRYP